MTQQEGPDPVAPVPERILAAAAELIEQGGWSGITMTKVAALAGVSRQTVYNEFGTRPALARAIVMRELMAVLNTVESAFDAHRDDVADAIRAAVLAVLEYAERNPLLGAALVGGPGNELLAPLTSDSGLLLDSAKAVVFDQIRSFGLRVSEVELRDGVDLIVRAVLSHMLNGAYVTRLPCPNLGMTECAECR